MRTLLAVALMLVALSSYASFLHPLNEPDLAHTDASEASLILPSVGAIECTASKPIDDRDQNRGFGTD